VAGLRKVARTFLPYEMRLRIALLKRAWRDYRSGTVFLDGSNRLRAASFVHSTYELPFIDYPGQESLATAKRNNQRLLAEALDGAVLGPGETFSLWRLAGRPRSVEGYAPAAAIREHQLVTELGGATCLLSTVVYNAALLAGLETTERYCHSVDTYGEDRYFELGRDCAIVFGYRDLRFRNPFEYPVTLSVSSNSLRVRAAVRGQHPRDFTVQLLVSKPIIEPHRTHILVGDGLAPGEEIEVCVGQDGIRTRTVQQVVRADGSTRTRDLGESQHVRIDRVLKRAPVGERSSRRSRSYLPTSQARLALTPVVTIIGGLLRLPVLLFRYGPDQGQRVRRLVRYRCSR